MRSVEKSKLTAADLDLRVRARHVSSGAIDPKTVERLLADLPDLDAQCETIPHPQPALGDRTSGDGH